MPSKVNHQRIEVVLFSSSNKSNPLNEYYDILCDVYTVSLADVKADNFTGDV